MAFRLTKERLAVMKVLAAARGGGLTGDEVSNALPRTVKADAVVLLTSLVENGYVEYRAKDDLWPSEAKLGEPCLATYPHSDGYYRLTDKGRKTPRA